MRLEPIIQMPATWSGVDLHFAVHLFEGRLTLEDMDRLQAEGDRWHRNNVVELVELVVIYPSKAWMTGAERSRMVTLIRRWEQRRRASATVILADGLVGAAQRSILTGLVLLAPPPHPAKVFGDVGDAVSWLLPHVQALAGSELTLLEMLGAVRELRTGFEARRQRAPMVS